MADQQPTADWDAGIRVLSAAQDVITNLRMPGASRRVIALRHALDSLTEIDPTSAVLVSAAIWLDRYGTSGAPKRLTDLQRAVDALPKWALDQATQLDT